MGTRADFYVKVGKKLEQNNWVGSIAFDGYPSGVDKAVKKATSIYKFHVALEKFFKDRNDVTYPRDGWPWPWDDSGTTDYAYVFDSEKKKVTWKKMAYPDMSKIKNMTLGRRSGLFVIGGN